MNYIYVLIDPRDNDVRYVGKSCRPKERLANQCNEKAHTYRCHWIGELRKLGLKPIQTIIEKMDDNACWQTREQYWIRYYKLLGCRLVNGTDGGDGIVNLCAESRAKIVATWKGRKHKPESLIKIGLASRGRRHTPEWRKVMHDKLKGRQFSLEDRLKLSRGVSKLDEAQIEQVRQLLSQKVSQYKIADMFGVHQGTISNIHTGKFYKWMAKAV